MSTPFANAPDRLLRLGNKFALRRGLDTQDSPATMEEAYRQVIELQLREMRDVAQDIYYREANALVAEEGLLDATPQAGAGPVRDVWRVNLAHFYTSKRNGRTLCAGVIRGVKRGALRGRRRLLVCDTSPHRRHS